MKKQEQQVSAGELMARLRADPRFVADRQKEEDERQRRAAELQVAEAPLVRELRSAGHAVESVWDLVNTAAPYPDAVQILLRHLVRSYPAPVREGIARALAVPEAKTGWSVLVRAYRDEREQRPKDGLAVAVAAVSDDDVISEVIGLARDQRLGASRVMLLGALERSKDSRARTALKELATDEELEKEIGIILRRLNKGGH